MTASGQELDIGGQIFGKTVTDSSVLQGWRPQEIQAT